MVRATSAFGQGFSGRGLVRYCSVAPFDLSSFCGLVVGYWLLGVGYWVLEQVWAVKCFCRVSGRKVSHRSRVCRVFSKYDNHRSPRPKLQSNSRNRPVRPPFAPCRHSVHIVSGPIHGLVCLSFSLLLCPSDCPTSASFAYARYHTAAKGRAAHTQREETRKTDEREINLSNDVDYYGAEFPTVVRLLASLSRVCPALSWPSSRPRPLSAVPPSGRVLPAVLHPPFVVSHTRCRGRIEGFVGMRVRSI